MGPQPGAAQSPQLSQRSSASMQAAPLVTGPHNGTADGANTYAPVPSASGQEQGLSVRTNKGSGRGAGKLRQQGNSSHPQLHQEVQSPPQHHSMQHLQSPSAGNLLHGKAPEGAALSQHSYSSSPSAAGIAWQLRHLSHGDLHMAPGSTPGTTAVHQGPLGHTARPGNQPSSPSNASAAAAFQQMQVVHHAQQQQHNPHMPMYYYPLPPAQAPLGATTLPVSGGPMPRGFAGIVGHASMPIPMPMQVPPTALTQTLIRVQHPGGHHLPSSTSIGYTPSSSSPAPHSPAAGQQRTGLQPQASMSNVGGSSSVSVPGGGSSLSTAKAGTSNAGSTESAAQGDAHNEGQGSGSTGDQGLARAQSSCSTPGPCTPPAGNQVRQGPDLSHGSATMSSGPRALTGSWCGRA
jgi:hypothetical protein